MQPNMAEQVRQGQNRQKTGHNQHARGRQFSLEDPVFVRDFAASSQTWLPGTVVGQRGPLSLDVELEDGRVLRRHVDHVRVRSCKAPREEQGNQYDDSVSLQVVPTSEELAGEPEASTTTVTLRRSMRERRPPVRYPCEEIRSISTMKGGV